MGTADPLYDPALTGGGVTLNAGQLAGRGASSGTGTEEAITLGTNLSMSGTTLNANAGSGAPSGAQYLTLALDAGLSAERVATATARVTITDSGANGTATFDIGTNSVDNAYIRQGAARSVIGRAANSTGNVADIAGGGAGTYLNDSGSAAAFTAITDIIQNLNLSGDLSPAQITASQNDYNPTSLATASILRLDLDAARSITGIAGGADGRVLGIFNTSAFTLTLTDASASSSAANRFDFNGDLALGSKHGAILWYDSTSSRWRLLSRAFPFTAAASTVTLTAGAGLTGGGDLSTNRTFNVAANADGTITVNADDIQVGTLIAANIPSALITDAKLANMGALTVKGRSANSAGVPADIAAVAASDGVLRESGSTIGFGTIATAGIANSAVTYAKIANAGALAVVGRSANSSGVLADIQATAASDAVLRENGSTIGFGTIATGGIANNAVTDAKLRTGAALTVIGRSANSTGNVADIQATAASDAVLRENGSTVGFGTVATGGIANNAITDAKLRTGAALTVIGRSANSTGNVADIAASAASGAVLRESGSTIGFGTIATAGITDAAVTYAKIQNGGARSVLGRSANSSGVLADISGAGAGTVLVDNGTTVGFAFLPPVVVALTDAATITVDASLIPHGGSFTVTLGGNRTMGNPTNAVDGKMITFAIRQDATGSRTITWSANYRFTTTVTSPTLSTGNGKTDYIAFRYNGTDSKWDAMAVNLAA